MTAHPDHAGFEAIRLWLDRQCGLNFPSTKSELLRQRMTRVTLRFGMADLNRLAEELRPGGSHDVQLAVMDEASIHHTYFFREPDVLDRFFDMALPGLRDRSEFRFWSVACSTGEEVYSIAIMLTERLSPAALERLSFLGTDISASVVERAELGLYPARQFAHTGAQRLQRWFTPTGIDQYRVKPALRDACTFRRMNLKATPYPFERPFQAVFCRNVLYYFDQAGQAATVRALYDMVEPGGWLVTSVTESVRQLGTLWEPVATGLFRRGW